MGTPVAVIKSMAAKQTVFMYPQNHRESSLSGKRFDIYPLSVSPGKPRGAWTSSPRVPQVAKMARAGWEGGPSWSRAARDAGRAASSRAPGKIPPGVWPLPAHRPSRSWAASDPPELLPSGCPSGDRPPPPGHAQVPAPPRARFRGSEGPESAGAARTKREKWGSPRSSAKKARLILASSERGRPGRGGRKDPPPEASAPGMPPGNNGASGEDGWAAQGEGGWGGGQEGHKGSRAFGRGKATPGHPPPIARRLTLLLEERQQRREVPPEQDHHPDAPARVLLLGPLAAAAALPEQEEGPASWRGGRRPRGQRRDNEGRDFARSPAARIPTRRRLPRRPRSSLAAPQSSTCRGSERATEARLSSCVSPAPGGCFSPTG